MSTLINNEVPSGLVNGVNTSFTLTNSVLKLDDITIDGATYLGLYRITGADIELADAPATEIFVSYYPDEPDSYSNSINSYISNEAPEGVINGSNTTFTLDFTPLQIARVYIDGVIYTENITITGNDIIVPDAPTATIEVDYYMTGDGKSVLDLYNSALLVVPDLDKDKFKEYLNEANVELMYELQDNNKELFRKKYERDLPTIDVEELELPSAIRVIDRVELLHESDRDTFGARKQKLPLIEFDTDYDFGKGYRYYRQGSSIFIRGIDEGQTFGLLTIWYYPVVAQLDEDTDKPIFDPNKHSILLDYVYYKYYDDENMETDGNKWLASWERKKGKMLNTSKGTKEKKRIKLKVNNGFPSMQQIGSLRSSFGRYGY